MHLRMFQMLPDTTIRLGARRGHHLGHQGGRDPMRLWLLKLRWSQMLPDTAFHLGARHGCRQLLLLLGMEY